MKKLLVLFILMLASYYATYPADNALHNEEQVAAEYNNIIDSFSSLSNQAVIDRTHGRTAHESDAIKFFNLAKKALKPWGFPTYEDGGPIVPAHEHITNITNSLLTLAQLDPNESNDCNYAINILAGVKHHRTDTLDC